MNPLTDSVAAAVAIGRNEAQRLAACLASVRSQVDFVIYVDSGSSDGSVAVAESAGVAAISLAQGPYTAARGRQCGLDEALRRRPGIEFILFIDGDCVLEPGFLPEAMKYLRAHDDVAAVCARRREERYVQSFYSRLIDVDWDIPPGPVPHIGGDALVRVSAIRDAGGWPVELIAGEEPDLCFRMAAKGWRIERLPIEMTRHDVRMTRFAEYWRRAVRSGHAYAEIGLRHRKGPGRDWLRMAASIVFYGALAPVAGIVGGLLFWPIGILVALLYLRLILSMALSVRRRGHRGGLGIAYALCNTLCKIAGAIGVVTYFANRMIGKRAALIEYRSDAVPVAPTFSTVSKEPCA